MTQQLTEGERAELRSQLEHSRSRLRRQIQSLLVAEGAVEIEDPSRFGTMVEDQGEIGADQAAWDLDRMNELAARDALAGVEHALAKFATGTYGVCERCGQPIPLARLRVVPEARYDVRHEAEVELEETAPARMTSADHD
jgi:RNA polymerase-binding transcription factor DksA